MLRPSIVSTRLAFIVSHLSQPTPFQRRLWEGSISAKPSRIFWREICTPVISSCAHTHVSPTFPSLARNSQVGWLRLYLLFPNPGNRAHLLPLRWWMYSYHVWIESTLKLVKSRLGFAKIMLMASDNLYCSYHDINLVSTVDVGPASMLVGNLVAGKRIAQAIGRELGVVEDQDLIRKVLF